MPMTGAYWQMQTEMRTALESRRQQLEQESQALDKLLAAAMSAERAIIAKQGVAPSVIVDRVRLYCKWRGTPVPLDLLYGLLQVDDIDVGGEGDEEALEVVRIKLHAASASVVYLNKYGYWPADWDHVESGYKGVKA